MRKRIIFLLVFLSTIAFGQEKGFVNYYPGFSFIVNEDYGSADSIKFTIYDDNNIGTSLSGWVNWGDTVIYFTNLKGGNGKTFSYLYNDQDDHNVEVVFTSWSINSGEDWGVDLSRVGIHGNLLAADFTGCYILQYISVASQENLSILVTDNCTLLTNISAAGTGILDYEPLNCPSLISLDFGGSALTTIIFLGIPNLTNIALDNCSNITSLDFTPTLNIHTIYASSCTGLITFAVAGLHNLTTVTVNGCSNLEGLYVYSCPVSSLGLGSNPKLTYIRIDDCRLTEQNITDIITELPNYSVAGGPGAYWMTPQQEGYPQTLTQGQINALTAKHWYAD